MEKIGILRKTEIFDEKHIYNSLCVSSLTSDNLKCHVILSHVKSLTTRSKYLYLPYTGKLLEK